MRHTLNAESVRLAPHLHGLGESGRAGPGSMVLHQRHMLALRRIEKYRAFYNSLACIREKTWLHKSAL